MSGREALVFLDWKAFMLPHDFPLLPPLGDHFPRLLNNMLSGAAVAH